jgi:outer membrane lipoprotein-sorting protein
MRQKIIIMLILFLCPWTSVMADDQLAGILEGVQKRYGPLPGLAVSYEREVITRSMAMLGIQTQKDLASGMIYFKPPNSLKVQQETPDPEVVIINKDTLWWYIPQKKQVYKYPSHKLGQEMQLLSDIFRGLQQVESRFKVTLIAYHTDTGCEIKLEPDPPWEQIDHIKLWIDRGKYTIRIIEIYNYLGGLTRFTLGEPSARDVFEENFFHFLVPEGVTVIEE